MIHIMCVKFNHPDFARAFYPGAAINQGFQLIE